MHVRWTIDAADDLAQIVERIRTNNQDAALHVARTIYNGIASLRDFPNRGREPRTQESFCFLRGLT